MSAVPPSLTPVQARTMADLRDGPRPSFPADVGARLRHDLESGLAPVLGDLGADEVLAVSKHILGEVHGCEVKLVAEADAPFEPSIPVVRGAVAHKAIELGVHWKGEPVPLELVDDAIARLMGAEVWLSDFLQRCTRGDLAELRSTAGDRVSKFFECFPPLKPSWRPVTESSQHVDLLDGRVVLRGKVDLTLGTPDGTTAGKVVIDLKTGAPTPRHRDDLRFYALLDAIRIGVPPRLVASFYLDQGEARTEPVSEAVLDAAVARTVDGARRWAALQAGTAAPVHRPGPGCRWCSIRSGCAPGRAWLEGDAEAAGELLAVGEDG